MTDLDSLEAVSRVLTSTCNLLKKSEEKQETEVIQKCYDVIDEIMWQVLQPSNSEVILNETLNRKVITSCRLLLCGDGSFDEFSRKVREYDDAPACGLVWTPNFVAYRCRTCALTPCMSMCSECFLAGNHEGHDYNMFRSQAGGACDCGDANVMNETGFCPKHASARSERKMPPKDLLAVPECILAHLCCRLIFHFRENPAPTSFVETGNLVSFLQSLSDMGAAMKNVICRALIDGDAYSRMTRVSHQSGEQAAYISRSSSHVASVLDTIDSIATHDDADALDCPELCAPIEYQCLVDEFMFWLVKYEFPQKLVTLLLSLLSNEEYKTRFAVAFVKHYTRTATLVSSQRANEMVANRVIHMSVQLMSSERLSLRLNKDHKLLRILVVSLHNMIKKGLTECTLHTTVRNFHRVADCSSAIMENHNYWALASDLHSVLGNKALARAFLRDPALVDLWCNFIAFFQGMNVNTRQLEQHLEYESRAYYPAFTAEVEICSAIMWCLVHQLKDERLYDCILYTMQYVLGQIQEWFENIHFVPEGCWKPPRLSVTFHLPLHRLYSAFVCEGIKMGMQVLFPSETFLRQLAMHPLQIQVVRSEISAGMWVRNGQPIRYQSCLYVQSHFCASFQDLDVYLLQICGARVHPDWFVLTIFERFHLVEWFSFAPAYPMKRFLRPDWEMPMLEGALRLVATLVCNATHLGMNEEDSMRMEIATLLAMSNKTHSQILDQLPDTGTTGHSVNLVEQILEELATYQPPQFEPGGAMRQGIYVPKDVVWLEYFDPLFVMLRSMQMKEYQDAFMRYTDFVRRSGLYKNKGPPWPPLRIPQHILSIYDTLRRILHCRSLHAVLYVILFKAVAELCPVSEQALHLVIYLLELAVQLPPPGAAITEAVNKRRTVLNLQFCGWFPGNCLFTNLCHRMDRILHIDNMPGLSRSCQDDSDTDADFPDLVRLRAKLSGSSLVTSPDNQLVSSQVPRSRSGDIPFIDSIETDFDVDTDYFYNSAMAYLPATLRRQYLTNSPERLALTMDGETMTATEDMSLVLADCEKQLTTTGGEQNEEFGMQDNEPELHTGQQQAQLAIECTPSEERSLVVLGAGHMVQSGRHPGTSHDTANDSLPSTEELRGLPSSSSPPKSLPQPKVHVVNTGESLVTLLIKLHNKMAGDGRVYQPPEKEQLSRTSVGDGPSLIRNLLDKIYFLSSTCRREIESLCEALNSPKKTDDLMREDVVMAKKKAAKERQQRLMAQFTSKQKAVMDQLLQQEAPAVPESSEMGDSQEGHSTDKEKFECVICNQASSNVAVRPIGLVTLATATSVFGKAYPEGEPFVPSIFDVTETHKSISRGQQENEYYQQLASSFNKLSCVSSTSMGWEGGICLSTCGHCVHFDCHEAYMQSVRTDVNRAETGSVLAADKGEFYCPLCRQLANCVLPLLHRDSSSKESEMMYGAVEKMDTGGQLDRLAIEIMQMMETDTASSLSYRGRAIGNACDRFVSRLMDATYPRFNEFANEMNASWAFLCGVVRTNLESQHIWNSSLAVQKRSCLGALLNLLPNQIANLMGDSVHHCRLEWSALTGVRLNRQLESLPLMKIGTEVPIILRDPIALLIRMALVIMQKSRSAEHFTVLCQALYNLVIFQSIVNVIEQYPRLVPLSFKESSMELTAESVILYGDTGTLARFILKTCFNDVRDGIDHEQRAASESEFNRAVDARCGQFLQAAAMMKRFGEMDDKSTHISDTFDDLEWLRSYVLGTVENGNAMGWTYTSGAKVLSGWIEELKQLTMQDQQWKTVLLKPLLWSRPRLIPLPKQFDVLFQRFHKARCQKCGTAPKETLLCLVCGDVVCFRDTCCMSNSLSEVETHAVDCGAGIGVYVSVQSSMILVTRQKKAAHWGSLYLDAHGEEDRGLKRGKPLSLSEERFAMLEHHWVSHMFDSACKRWFWIGQTWTNIVIPL